MPSLLEALERKYGSGGAASSAAPPCRDLPVAIFVPKRSPRLSVPTLLVLNDCDIDTAGDGAALDDKCADVEELDLAKNRLTKWDEVFGILHHMPQVKFVNLSFNRLSEQLTALNNLQGSNGTSWSYLNNLVLNSTRVDWASVQLLLKLLPVLEELHLSLNEYTCVDLGVQTPPLRHCNRNQDVKSESDQQTPDSNQNVTEQRNSEEDCDRLNNGEQEKAQDSEHVVHTDLKKLHFSGNPVTHWAEVCKLGYAFPNLESLVLNECPLSTLRVADGTCGEYSCKDCESRDKNAHVHDAFRHLRFLNLNNTCLETWDEIDRLAKFPALRSLRLQGWPLWERCEATEHERRQLVVARLPGARALNGGTVPPAEREAAERAFIRYYMERPEADRPDIYWELVGVHGKLDPLVSVDLRPEKRVKVTFTYGDISEARTVDVYRTVSDLKTRLERLAGIPASRMRLFYVDQELRDLQGPEEMRYPTKQLYSYNIHSGDEIIIESKQKH